MPLTGFCVDSRQIGAGQIFVALKTDKRDGHDFLGAAHAAKAGAAIVAVPNPMVSLPQLIVRDPLVAFQVIAREHRRAFRGRVVGISGSAGKTSTKDLLALLLGGGSCGVIAAEDKRSACRAESPNPAVARGVKNPAGYGDSALHANQMEPCLTGRVLATEGSSGAGHLRLDQ